jgi:hypothetical protein
MPGRIAIQTRARAALAAARHSVRPACAAAAIVAVLSPSPALAKRVHKSATQASSAARASGPSSRAIAARGPGSVAGDSEAETAASGTSIVDEALASVEDAAPSLLAPSLPAELEGTSAQPSLVDGGEELIGAGTLTSSTVSKLPGAEFAIETAEGELPIRPLGAAASTLAPALVNGVAALFAGSADSIATVVRPIPLGASVTFALDAPAAPRSMTWEVRLRPGERLVSLPGGGAAVLGDGPGTSLQQPPSAEALGLADALGTGATAVARGKAIATSPSSSGGDEAEPASALPAVTSLTTPPAPTRGGEAQPQQTGGAYATQLSQLRRAESQTSEASMLLAIGKPHATDAAGEALSSTLSVSGNELMLTISAPESASYPLAAAIPVTAPSDAVTAARHRAVYGLADDRPGSFGAGLSSQLREGPLRVGVARLVIPYEVALTGGPELTRLREWLHAVGETRDAEGAPLQPYITLWSQGCLDRDGEGCTPPTAVRYREAVTALMSEYGNGEPSEGLPAVKLWGAWNEPNDSEARFPAGAAGELWQIANAVAQESGCGCEVAAGEFAGFPSSYAAQYKSFMLEHGLRPGIWGMHDYGDLVEVPSRSEAPLSSYANRRVRELVALTSSRLGKPRLWLSEQGVELESTGGATRLLASPELQALAAEDFLRLAGESTRIQLVDYYMQGAPEGFSEADGYYRAHPEAEGVPVFDSSLFTEAGAPTAALCVIGYESHAC